MGLHLDSRDDDDDDDSSAFTIQEDSEGPYATVALAPARPSAAAGNNKAAIPTASDSIKNAGPHAPYVNITISDPLTSDTRTNSTASSIAGYKEVPSDGSYATLLGDRGLRGPADRETSGTYETVGGSTYAIPEVRNSSGSRRKHTEAPSLPPRDEPGTTNRRNNQLSGKL